MKRLISLISTHGKTGKQVTQEAWSAYKKYREVEAKVLKNAVDSENIHVTGNIGKDVPFKLIDQEVCRVIQFNPTGKVVNGKVIIFSKFIPYASVIIECQKLNGNYLLWITNATDFLNLWSAYKDRGVNGDEEVLICWSVNLYKPKFVKLISSILPHLVVMIFPKNAYNLIHDSTLRPDLRGEARAKATMPIMQWKPDIME